MLADKAETPLLSEAKHRATFFRQSGWLMLASIAGGLLMWGTHFLAKAKSVPATDYATFGEFLAVVILLPTIPLQMILAQQTAKGLANHRERELSGVIRFLCLCALGLWLVACIAVWALQGSILQRLHLTTAVGLWITMLVVLFQLWLPMFSGVLQGQQNFLWLGWTLLISGIGRVSVAFFAVLALHAGSTGMLLGVLVGVAAAGGGAAWWCRSL
jgi:O-antigen/teichoic acid export membrane protein